MTLLKAAFSALALGALAACAAVPSTAVQSAPRDAALDAVVAGEWRSAEQKARDVYRRPVEALTFWGLKPGMTVIEVSPGPEAWWTEILAPYAQRTGGRYIAAHTDLANPRISDGARRLRADFEARFQGRPDLYGDVSLVGFGPVSAPLGPPNSVDFILTARSIHGWIRANMVDKAFADFYAVLKPGGRLAVEQHRAAPSVVDPKFMMDTGYVSESFVIEAAQRAGFELAGRSELNANPLDTKDHPFGVWTLPPTRLTAPFGQPENPNFDRARYDAIGESDRMTLVFVKPAA